MCSTRFCCYITLSGLSCYIQEAIFTFSKRILFRNPKERERKFEIRFFYSFVYAAFAQFLPLKSNMNVACMYDLRKIGCIGKIASKSCLKPLWLDNFNALEESRYLR